MLWEDPSGPLVISRLEAPLGGSYRLRFGEEIVVDVCPEQRIIAGTSRPGSEAALDHFLADQVFPRVMSHGKALIIHSGAIQVDDGAILLLGSSGRGKSTLSASFAQAGYRLMGDDAMVISWRQGLAYANAVYPSLRLLPDSIAAVLPKSVKTTPIAHYSAKQRVDLIFPALNSPGPLLIRAIFLLDHPSGHDQVRVDPLTVAQACIAMVENSFALDPSDLHMAQLRLQSATALSRQAPAFGLSYPRDYARLPDVKKAILSHLE